MHDTNMHTVYAPTVPATSMPLLAALERYRLWVVGLLAAFMYVGSESQLTGRNDWQYFVFGSDVLFGDRPELARGAELVQTGDAGGLSVYAEHPFLQIGPPALALARGLRLGPDDGIYMAAAVVQALGLLTVLLLDRALRDSGRHTALAVLMGGSFLTVIWGSVTHYTHLDDAMALACVAGAVLYGRRERWAAAGALLGLGAACKPWAVVLVVLVLAAPTWRQRWTAAAAAALVVLLWWGPFVIADVRTLTLSEFHLEAMSGSALRTLGLQDLATHPLLRPGQFALGAAAATVAVVRGRWLVAPLLGFSTRLLLDPNAYAYYGAGLAVAALVVDLAVLRFRIPVLSSLVLLNFLLPELLQSPVATGTVHAAVYLALITAALLLCCAPRTALAPVPSRAAAT